MIHTVHSHLFLKSFYVLYFELYAYYIRQNINQLISGYMSTLKTCCGAANAGGGSEQRLDEQVFSLKPLQEKNIPLLYSWTQQAHVAEWWRDKVDLASFTVKYQAKISHPYKHPFIIEYNNKAIGYIETYQADKIGNGWWLDQPAGTWGIDIFIGELEYIGKGFGSRLLKQIVRKLFQDQSIKKIIIDPAPDNLRAIRCYEKVGFKRVGITPTPYGQEMLMEMKKLDFVGS